MIFQERLDFFQGFGDGDVDLSAYIAFLVFDPLIQNPLIQSHVFQFLLPCRACHGFTIPLIAFS
jgi:hypothetical protein